MAKLPPTLGIALLLVGVVWLFGRRFPGPTGLASCIDEPELALRAHSAKLATVQHTPALRHLFGLPHLLDSPARCYNATARLRPYGYSADDRLGPGRALWLGRDWGQHQHRCAARNRLLPGRELEPRPRLSLPRKDTSRDRSPAAARLTSPLPRTAVVLRTSDKFDWAGDIIPFVRSMVVELSLESGGLYEVFILVQITDMKKNAGIFVDPNAYDRVLRKLVPTEFQNMTYLWNVNLLRAWYPEVPEHGYMHQTYQALQLFSNFTAPDFDYFWQFEMDFRSSAPHLQTLERMAAWAKEQPRLYLTNMNAAWYIPSLQGSWRDLWSLMNESLWNEERAADAQKYGTSWGVGEEADLITLAPIVDVRSTDFWLWRGMLHNDPYYTKQRRLPHFAAPVAMTRTSRRLLQHVHALQQKYGFWMASEATMETVAFHAGFKAVHAQHPVYYNGTESDTVLDWLFNSGGAENLGGGPDSQYNWDDPAHRVLEKLTWWFPREGYDHYPQHVWENFLNNQICLPAGLFHPFKWDKFHPPPK